MKKIIKVIFTCIVLILVLLIVTCENHSSESDVVTSIDNIATNEIALDENRKEIDVSSTFGSTYKMFYGEWEITRVLGYDYHLDKSFTEADENIGSIINYDKEKISSEEISVENLLYSYTINPNTPDLCYFYNTITNEELGLKGEYYVFVHVETYIPNVNLGISFVGDEFFILDDETLILVKNNVFYLAKRKSHIEDPDKIDYSHY